MSQDIGDTRTCGSRFGCCHFGVFPANVRRQLRKVLGDAGIEGVSPHMFRRTVATVINEQPV